MLWTLWDILIPLLITFALGLILGWLLWRWRRRRVTAAQFASLESPVEQASDDELAEQLRNSTDQLAQVKRELEIERNSNQLLKNKVDGMRQQDLDEAENGVVVDTSKVELEVGMVQLEKDRDLLRAKLDECQRKGQTQNDEIAALNASLADAEDNNQKLTADLGTAKAERIRIEDKLQQLEQDAPSSASGDQSADAAARIAELEGQLVQAQGALANNDATVLRTKLEQVEADLHDRNNALATAEQQLARSKQEVEQAMSARQSAEAGAADNADQSAKLDEMRATVEQKDDEIARLKRSLQAAQDEARHDPADSADSADSAESGAKGAGADSAGNSDLAGWGMAGGSAESGAKYNTESRAVDARGSAVQTAAPGGSVGNASANDGNAPASAQSSDASDDSSAGGTNANTAAAGASGTAATGSSAADSTQTQADKSTRTDGQKSDSSQPGDSAQGSASNGAAKTQSASSDAVSKNTSGGVTASGYVPIGWEVPSTIPDKKERDKLTDIKGVGPKLEGVLHANGIYYFRQIALLDPAGLDELQEQMPEFRGRIQRDNWLGQAVDLHREKYGDEP
jgi:predicted flap endonuclease-1-like 5' DNA nuclease